MPDNTPAAPAWPAALIEAMARAMRVDADGRDDWQADDDLRKAWLASGIVALGALCASRPDIAAILRGEAVAVPREATKEMLIAAAVVDNNAYAGGAQHGADDESIYYAMLAASPYARGGWRMSGEIKAALDAAGQAPVMAA